MAKFNFEKWSKAYAILNAKKNSIEADMKTLKAKLEEQVNLVPERKVSNRYTTMFFKSGSTRETVDLKKLKEADPDLYEALNSKGYIKTTTVKESFDIKCQAVLLEEND